MFVKRIENKFADAEVSNQIFRCSCCGKPMWGMSKMGSMDAVVTVCPECLNKQTENVEINDDRITDR